MTRKSRRRRSARILSRANREVASDIYPSFRPGGYDPESSGSTRHFWRRPMYRPAPAFSRPRGGPGSPEPVRYLIRTVLGDTTTSGVYPAKRTTTPGRPSLTTVQNRARSLRPNTLVCVRRRQRKEVLFARRLTGKGSRGRKRFRLSSTMRC